jgi:hypothetical protein
MIQATGHWSHYGYPVSIPGQSMFRSWQKMKYFTAAGFSRNTSNFRSETRLENVTHFYLSVLRKKQNGRLQLVAGGKECQMALLKVKLSCTRHAGVKGDRSCISYSFFTSVLKGGEWSESRPGRALRPALRAGLDTEVRGKILCLCQGSNPGSPVCCQTLY